ncbi:hypothetical protein BGX21_001582 [Mortierella sp. AD011]|nr:hypothetical protein BGX20_001360 [Mortierella sp. AD010]KAF9383398.1 hypothetical protein BGX21_001582 [Mortierella sp. AD011]
MKITLISLATVAFAIASVSAAPIKKRAGDNKVVVGYWVPWGDVPVSAVDFTKYTHINYGFGTLLKSAANPTDINFDRYYDGDNMQQLVQKGSQYGVPILMSLGGWTGSETFSTVVADTNLRKTFINNAMVFVRENTNGDDATTPNGWNMDGIDFDWEYPGRQGADNNAVSSADSANYLLLLKELRAQLDLEFPNNHKLITAAVRVQPFDGPNGSPLSNVAAYAAYFDWISIMAYDIYGSWSDTTGPVAPLGTPPSPNGPYSVTQAVQSWTAAGWPEDQLVVGTAFYGYSFTATVNMNTQNPITQYVPFTSGSNTASSDACNGLYTTGATWSWKSLRSCILTAGPTTAASGWTRYWDSNTQTPWVFRASDKTFISYDDIESITAKVNFVKQKNLRGVMLWEIDYDINGELIGALNLVHSGSTTTTTASPTKTTTTVSKTTTAATTTTTVSTKTTTTVAPTTTSGSSICSGVAAWSSSTTYATPGSKVTYNGHLWTNQWWTLGETPGAAWGAWADGGAC